MSNSLWQEFKYVLEWKEQLPLHIHARPFICLWCVNGWVWLVWHQSTHDVLTSFIHGAPRLALPAGHLCWYQAGTDVHMAIAGNLSTDVSGTVGIRCMHPLVPDNMIWMVLSTADGWSVHGYHYILLCTWETQADYEFGWKKDVRCHCFCYF